MNTDKAQESFEQMKQPLAIGAIAIALLVGIGMMLAPAQTAEADSSMAANNRVALLTAGDAGPSEQNSYYRYAWGSTAEVAWHYAGILESWGYRIVSDAYWGRVPEAASGYAYRIDVIWPG